MLNSKGERELCYVTIVDAVTPIEGYDKVELAHVGGWTVVVGKGEFQAGDPAIYFEIDSKLPEVEPFTNMEFLAKKHYKIKTQKMCRCLSQGLLMSAANFGWYISNVSIDKITSVIVDKNAHEHSVDDESRFLTKQLGVTYAVAEDNKRKGSNPDAKINAALARYPKIAKKYGRFIKKHKLTRWLFFLLFGKKQDKKSSWPVWVQKTDEERVQNMPWILEDKEPWIATEKIDGTSTSFTIKRRGLHGKYDFFVCSRNVVFDKPDKECFYETNVYIEMAEKYNIENKMKNMLFANDNFADCEWITIQGETYGDGIQKRGYSLKEHSLMAFNFIDSKRGRWNTIEMKNFLEKCGIPCVPVVDENYILPDSIDELLAYATGKSVIDNGMREGIVFRSLDGTKSFKAVSNEFLLKYHQ